MIVPNYNSEEICISPAWVANVGDLQKGEVHLFPREISNLSAAKAGSGGVNGIKKKKKKEGKGKNKGGSWQVERQAPTGQKHCRSLGIAFAHGSCV